MSLDEQKFKRFVQFCGMMTSDHDGECLTAARKATEILKNAKLTWGEVLSGKVKITAGDRDSSDPPHGQRRTPSHKHVLRAKKLLERPHRLSERELSFVKQMLEWRHPTSKQLDWLQKIYDRVMS